MSTLLYIKANPKPDRESVTFRVSENFIDTYKEHHPKDDVITLDLYSEGVNHWMQRILMTYSIQR